MGVEVVEGLERWNSSGGARSLEPSWLSLRVDPGEIEYQVSFKPSGAEL